MNTQELVDQIHQKKSFLCIGLDVDLDKIPEHLLQDEDPIFSFNKQIDIRQYFIVTIIF